MQRHMTGGLKFTICACSEAMGTSADAFIAFSYPPDTFMLAPFPGFKAKFGNNVNGILLYGGLDTGAPGLQET